MKILFVAPRFHTNQVPIVRALAEKGHNIIFHVATIGPVEDHTLVKPKIIKESLLSKLNRKIFGEHGVNKRSYFPSPLCYFREILREKPDIAIIRVHGRPFTYISAICAKLCGAHIIFYDQIPIETLPKFRFKPDQFLRWLRYKTPTLLFNAAWMSPLGMPGVRYDSRRYFIPFVASTDTDPLPKNNPIRIITVGKYQKRKNQLLLAKVLSRLILKYDFNVTFIGEVSNEEHIINRKILQEYVESSPLREVGKFIDNVSHGDMHSIYRKHDIFVLPASNEPASISPLEAMAAGLPVIVSTTCGTKCYVDSDSGSVFESDNEESLYTALENVINSQETISIKKELALQSAKRKFSDKVYFEMFSSLLKKEFGILI